MNVSKDPSWSIKAFAATAAYFSALTLLLTHFVSLITFVQSPPCWDIPGSTWALYDLRRTAHILRVTTEEQESTPLLLQAIFVLPDTACISSVVAFHYQPPTTNLACDYSSTGRSKQVLRPASRSPNCKSGPAFLSTSGIAGDTPCGKGSIVTAS